MVEAGELKIRHNESPVEKVDSAEVFLICGSPEIPGFPACCPSGTVGFTSLIAAKRGTHLKASRRASLASQRSEAWPRYLRSGRGPAYAVDQSYRIFRKRIAAPCHMLVRTRED